MTLGKKILQFYKDVLCRLRGHTANNICKRCGRPVWLSDKKPKQ